MQVGGKNDETGWGVYEECRKEGAMIATGHEHSYSRTFLMDSFEQQIVATTSDILLLEKGKSFAFVSGIGGHSVRQQKLKGDWWASIYTLDQEARAGALFCTFDTPSKQVEVGEKKKANCYFKDIAGKVVDRFVLVK